MDFILNRVEFGDCRETLRRWAAQGVRAQTCVTSPPYFGLRDYQHAAQIGLEETPEQYIAALVEVFRCVWDVLADDGTLWVNIGDSYTSGNRKTRDADDKDASRAMSFRAPTPNGLKPKDLIGIPWMLAFALRADGWHLRQDIVWHKTNPMPESVRDRCTKAHEYIFLLSKSERYYFDSDAMKEPAIGGKAAGNKRHKYADAYAQGESQEHRTKAGLTALAGVQWETRNRRSVWSVGSSPYVGAHFAVYPPELIRPCILAGSRPGDVVLDPFMGSGTTATVALQHGRKYLGCELNPEYEVLQRERIVSAVGPLFADL